MLVIEVDGAVHNTKFQVERDIGRSLFLQGLEIKVIRFTNDEIERDMPAVLKKIRSELSS